MSAASDRNLLFGILALQMDFINRDDVIVAMNAWVLDKTHSLGHILVEQGKLNPDTEALLEALVVKHLEQHGHAPERSLATLGPVVQTCDALGGIQDADVQASLAALPTPPLPHLSETV